MTLDRRSAVAAASVLALSLGALVPLALVPGEARAYLAVSCLVAVAMAVSSVVAEPRELLVALVFAVPPVMALTMEGAPAWAIGPLAMLLLVGGELNALSWELGGAEVDAKAVRARGGSIARLGAAGLLASLGVTVITRLTVPGGTVATVLAAGTLLVVGVLVLPSIGQAPDDPAE